MWTPRHTATEPKNSSVGERRAARGRTTGPDERQKHLLFRQDYLLSFSVNFHVQHPCLNRSFFSMHSILPDQFTYISNKPVTILRMSGAFCKSARIQLTEFSAFFLIFYKRVTYFILIFVQYPNPCFCYDSLYLILIVTVFFFLLPSVASAVIFTFLSLPALYVFTFPEALTVAYLV